MLGVQQQRIQISMHVIFFKYKYKVTRKQNNENRIVYETFCNITRHNYFKNENYETQNFFLLKGKISFIK